MSLDLFTGNIDDAVNYAARVSAPELPSTFQDNFDDAWNKGYLLNQSISGQIRKTRARSELVDSAIAKTGDQSFGQIEQDGFLDPQIFNAKLAEHKAQRPELDVQPISDEAIQARADEIGKAQLGDSASFARRERTAGGTFGQFVGTAAAAVTDPVNLIAFPLAAPESLGILGTALAWGGIGAGSQTLIEALNTSSMERIQPGYAGSSEQFHNILEAGVGGAVLGGGIKGLASAWTRAKTGSWSRTVRDAGNVVESEAQIAGTNPLPGVEGEAAHRTALNKAMDDLANGRPVDVENIVTPEQARFIDAYHGSPHDFERFDTSRIGTGEGMQAYGHGLYFAEHQGVAEGYARELGAKRGVYDMDPNSPTFGQFMDVSAGNVYRVRINADRERFLDYDKPLSEQSPEVRAFFEAQGIPEQFNYPRLSNKIGADAIDEMVPMSGADAYRRLGVKVGPAEMSDTVGREAAASKALSEAGIPGIKYLDQGSRDGGGTHNLVVFDDKHVTITHKNGKPVSAEIRQAVVDQAAGRPSAPPAQPELALAPPEPVKVQTPKHQSGQALDDQLTPDKIEEARLHPDMEETVARDLDKLMLERPALEVPTGVTVDAEGRTVPTTRKVEDVVAEADARLAAAKEVEACVGPYPSEAAA